MPAVCYAVVICTTPQPSGPAPTLRVYPERNVNLVDYRHPSPPPAHLGSIAAFDRNALLLPMLSLRVLASGARLLRTEDRRQNAHPHDAC